MIRSLFLLVALLFSATPALAQNDTKPDDSVSFSLSTEGWVTTQTARVMVGVEAAVSGAGAGTARADMTKAVEALAKGDWRLTSFSRNTDQTGLERWSAQFETRLPENMLTNLGEAAKKQSKAGMQISVQNIDFTPTLAENEAVAAQLRAQIYKNAAEQLSTLNSALPGRSYRIASITFAGPNGIMRPVAARAMNMMMAKGAAMNVADAAEIAPSFERSEKMIVNAMVVFSAKQ